jgi:hypothetical protein
LTNVRRDGTLTVVFLNSERIYMASEPRPTNGQEFQSYEQVVSSDFPLSVLIKVIARNFQSKHYTDLVPLDGGTVGIANFATGGLAELYRRMDTQKYFGRSTDEMVTHYSAGCRPEGRHGDDDGWGCYSKPWWRNGMKDFLDSPESKDVQNQAWLFLMKPTIDASLAHGWRDRRSLAIALGIANSVGGHGFVSMADANGWRPEQILSAYVGDGTNAHRIRRRNALNGAFPP